VPQNPAGKWILIIGGIGLALVLLFLIVSGLSWMVCARADRPAGHEQTHAFVAAQRPNDAFAGRVLRATAGRAQ
jgi:hypothetical protein